MEKNTFIKNISGTVCAVGLAISAMSLNSTMVINGEYKVPKIHYGHYKDYNENSTIPNDNVNNIYIDSNNITRNNITRLEKEATKLFGTMRYATAKEQNGINDYIKSISKETGVNFFDLC